MGRRAWFINFLAALTPVCLILAAPTRADTPPTTQELQGQVKDEKGQPISGAVCTVAGGALPTQGVPVTTDANGEFRIGGLLAGHYSVTCAAFGYLPAQKNNIEVTEIQALRLEVILPTEAVLRQTVEVTGTPSVVAQEKAAPSETLTSQNFIALPLAEQKFIAALPLVPGVVRTPNGKINIKGQVENQGLLLVDSAETVDPVTGSFSIDVPVGAIESISVYKTPYQAEYGSFTGGLTEIQTKPPADKWHLEFNDFEPDFRGKGGHLVGIADVKPRLDLTGPLFSDKLSFRESGWYQISKQPVRGLAWPHNETKTQGVTSFTSFQYIISNKNILSSDVEIFPVRRQFANINSLVPQTASSDYGQRGFTVGATDRFLWTSGGILTSLFKYTRFDSYAHGQGSLDMLITPNGWGGDFFNAWARAADQQEALEDYQFPKEAWLGEHTLKIGANLVHRTYSGSSESHPVQLVRQDGTVAERIDFSGRASLAAADSEASLYAQDHWALNEELALDLGLRYSGQSIGTTAAFGPRMGLVYSPRGSGRTILRAGVGVFHDRVPLLAGNFTSNPIRTLSFFDEQGNLLSPPQVLKNVYVQVDERGPHIISGGHDLGSTPYDLTWSFEADREIRPHVVLRLSYLASRTRQQFILDPRAADPANSILLLTNTGTSRYDEYEATLRVRPSERSELKIAYVHSRARGDLNTLTEVYVPFEQPVIRPDRYSALASDIPNRLVSWGSFEVPWGITASPLLDLHTGFPYSDVDVLQNYVGVPNSRRFPTFFSLDLRLMKNFRIFFIPWVNKHTLRGGLNIFNITNHDNPRDVFNNIASPVFGDFQGFQHRLYEMNLDILF